MFLSRTDVALDNVSHSGHFVRCNPAEEMPRLFTDYTRRSASLLLTLCLLELHLTRDRIILRAK